MKPIAIFRHSAAEGPGYFAAYLKAKNIPWQLICVDADEAIPHDPGAYAGLVFMGGPMSVNDDLPWIPSALQLIRSAVATDVPCLGHCLGGQLIAKALGGVVSANPVKEIGWGTVQVAPNTLARHWIGSARDFLAFHWHGETFTIPDDATRILSSRYCANQAFVLGKHLAMQCHVEMTPELIRSWCRGWEKDLSNRASDSVQTPAQMEEDIDARVRKLNAVAARLYDVWTGGLKA